MKKTLLVLMAAVLVFQGVAFAKEISGTVSSVNAVDSKLTISSTDENGAASDMEVAVSPEVVYTGIAKLDELTVGTMVQLEVEQNAAGAWEAKEVSVESGEASADAAAETEEAPMAQ